MKKQISITVFLLLILMSGCRPPQHNYYEPVIITAVAWHDTNHNNVCERTELVKQGEKNFKSGEGFILISPKSESQEMEIEIFTIGDERSVLKETSFWHKGTVQPITVSNLNLGNGAYRLRIILKDSGKIFEKLFWITGTSNNNSNSKENSYMSFCAGIENGKLIERDKTIYNLSKEDCWLIYWGNDINESTSISLTVYDNTKNSVYHTDNNANEKNNNNAWVKAWNLKGCFTGDRYNEGIFNFVISDKQNSKTISKKTSVYGLNKIISSTPTGLFVYNNWEDYNKNGKYDFNEFIGLNKDSYNPKKEDIRIGLNVIGQTGQVVFQSFNSNGELMGTTVDKEQHVESWWIGPSGQGSNPPDFIDIVGLNGKGNYEIKAIFNNGKTITKELNIID